jgi:hypothetical protein
MPHTNKGTSQRDEEHSLSPLWYRLSLEKTRPPNIANIIAYWLLCGVITWCTEATEYCVVWCESLLKLHILMWCCAWVHGSYRILWGVVCEITEATYYCVVLWMNSLKLQNLLWCCEWVHWSYILLCGGVSQFIEVVESCVVCEFTEAVEYCVVL